MVILSIPARNDLPWYKFSIALSGVIYTLHLRYNTRMQRWIMDINDASDNQILSGIPLLILRDLTGQYPTLPLPLGTFFVVDDTNTDTQATLFSFGTTNTILYADPTQ